MDFRCDSWKDCPDHSDEIGCGKLYFNSTGTGIKVGSPPVPRQGEPLKIKVDTELLEILDIKELEGRFRVKLNVRLQWYDKRLTYQNLREDYSLNMLDSEEFESIWFPKVNLEIFALLCHFSL